MLTTTMGGRDVHVDRDGFLSRYDDWNEDVARQLAANINIDLTDAHWQAIRFVREDYTAQGQTPTIERVTVFGHIPEKDLCALFPELPAVTMAYIAGLPKPHGYA